MRKVVNYLMLVGFPLLGVLGVLRLGESLKPTLCIGGSWRMEVSKQSANSSCQEQFRQAEPLGFSISQSGPQFSLSFNNNTKGVLHGEIQSIDVNATAPRFSSASFVKDENAIRMRATLDRHSEPARLWGVFSFNDCPDLNFVATHQNVPAVEVR